MIITVTANGAVERTMSTSGLTVSGVLRAHSVVLLASGKGTNAARTAHILGQPVICTGFVAGHSGHLLTQLAERDSLEARWTVIEGETRAAVIIVDDQAPGQDALLISEPGMVTTVADWHRLQDDVLAASGSEPCVVCIAGSNPPGTPLDFFSDFISTLRSHGHQVWVDIDGPSLRAALQARPTGIKINHQETGELLDQIPNKEYEVLESAQVIRSMGASKVVITLGKVGAIYVDGSESWQVTVPDVPAISSVGSGDAFLGGLAVGLDRRESIAMTLRRAAAAGAANTLQLGGGRFDRADYERLLPQVQVTRL